MKNFNLDTNVKNRHRLFPFFALFVAFIALVIGLFTILNTEISIPPTSSTQTPLLPQPSRFTIPCKFGPAHPLLVGPFPEIEGRITSPLHCTDTVLAGGTIEVKGIYFGNLDRLSLWIIVYTHDAYDNLFYPQAKDACRQKALELDTKTNHWSTEVRIGRLDTPGLYDIILAATPTNSLKNQRLNEWLLNVCQNGNLAGIKIDNFLATEGILVELDSITVSAYISKN